MGFIRENIAKILIFIGVLIIFIIIFSLLFGRGRAKKATTYFDLEDRMLAATKKYVNDNPKLLPKSEDETNKINSDTLINAEYLEPMVSIDDENVKCKGYSQLIYKNKKILIIPYLQCGKYYETKTIADHIISNESIVSSGDGLYQYNDSYVYRGENPKNYLQLGNRMYRIVEVNKNGEVKLITNEIIDAYFTWDNRYNISENKSYGINDYSKSRLKEKLNYIIDNNSFTDEEAEIKYFSEQEVTKMIPHDICVGKRPLKYGAIDYNNECQVLEKDQRLSLIVVSDYARASVDPNCKSIFDRSCINYNYFSKIDGVFRTVTAVSDNSYEVFYIDSGHADFARASNTFRTNIVIYIDKLSLYSNGDGSYQTPYIVR